MFDLRYKPLMDYNHYFLDVIHILKHSKFKNRSKLNLTYFHKMFFLKSKWYKDSQAMNDGRVKVIGSRFRWVLEDDN